MTPLQKAAAFQQAFWKFLRPHTIRGTILGSATVTARALIECPIVRCKAHSQAVRFFCCLFYSMCAQAVRMQP